MTIIVILFFISLAFPVGFAAYKGLGKIRKSNSVISSYYISGALSCLILSITPSIIMSASSYGIARPFGLTDSTRFWLSYPVAFLILFFFIVLSHITHIAKLNIAILPIVLLIQIYSARYLMTTYGKVYYDGWLNLILLSISIVIGIIQLFLLIVHFHSAKDLSLLIN